MTQPQMDMTNYLEFQLSLLRLSAIPGPNGTVMTDRLASEARKIEDIVGACVPLKRNVA